MERSHSSWPNRKAFQNSIASELIAGVDELSGRSTITVLSADHVDPDIAIESFVLAPQVAHDAGVGQAEI